MDDSLKRGDWVCAYGFDQARLPVLWVGRVRSFDAAAGEAELQYYKEVEKGWYTLCPMGEEEGAWYESREALSLIPSEEFVFDALTKRYQCTTDLWEYIGPLPDAGE